MHIPKANTAIVFSFSFHFLQTLLFPLLTSTSIPLCQRTFAHMLHYLSHPISLTNMYPCVLQWAKRQRANWTIIVKKEEKKTKQKNPNNLPQSHLCDVDCFTGLFLLFNQLCNHSNRSKVKKKGFKLKLKWSLTQTQSSLGWSLLGPFLLTETTGLAFFFFVLYCCTENWE